MKTSAIQRKKLKIERQKMATIAAQIRSQNHLDSMLMKYDDRKRRVIFKAMRPFLKFDAIYPTEENTKPITREDFAKLREKYA